MPTKPPACAECPLTRATGTLYTPPTLLPTTSILAVSDTPRDLNGPAGSWFNNMLNASGQRRSEVSTASVICCASNDGLFPLDKKWHATSRADAYRGVEYCKAHFLEPALAERAWKKVYAVGDYALTATTGKRGILVWRGSPLPLRSQPNALRVMPILAPSYLMRDSKMVPVTVSDLRKRVVAPPEIYNIFATTTDLAAYTSKVIAFDFEWDWHHNITLCGLSDRFYHATTGAWYGGNIAEFRRIFENATDLIGHNIIGADTRYFAKLGWTITARMHDTMLKQHLVQPDMRHGLGFVGSVFTNKVFWKGSGREVEDTEGNVIDAKVQWKTWASIDAIPRTLGGYGGCASDDEAYRLYNARDTDGSFQINTHLDTLLKQWGLESVYWNVSLPAAYIVRDIGERGIRIDPERVKVVRRELQTEIDSLELTLPEGLRPYDKPITKQIPAPPETYKPKAGKCRGGKKYGGAHPPTEVVFAGPTDAPTRPCIHCGRDLSRPAKFALIKRIKVPSSERIRPWNSSAKVLAYARERKLKMYVNRKTSSVAADVNSRKNWGRTHAEFRIIDALKDRQTELSNFAKQEMERVDRLFFNLLVHGTSEGRFSSSGQRDGIDPNIQNQPKSIRKIYIPDHADYSLIELDYAGGENTLTAYLAKDHERLERLRQPGYSEHLELCKAIFNLPASTTKKQASDYEGKDLYTVAKSINHGSNYGMTYVKLGEELEAEGYFYTVADCKEFIAAGKRLNPRTAEWQAETIALAQRDGYLRNPFGRMRWFSSRNTPTQALAFLPASSLADIIIRAMIAHYPEQFAKECEELKLVKTGALMPGAFLNIQVHDSLVLQGPHEVMRAQAERSAALMCQPWQALDGFSLAVECKMGAPGASWGELQVVHI